MTTRILFVCVAALLLVGNDLIAQDANIYGRIYMPAVEKQERTFRGRLYRNRLASRRTILDQQETQRSTFEDVVISAYPLSTRPQVKPLEQARILQKNAEFIPHVLPVTPGTRVEFINLDNFFHNVFSITPGARFNIGRRPTGTVITRTINRLGEVKLFCDIHTQMNAIIYCVDTPYFTRANENGVYLLDKLPPGRYRVEVYHPEFSVANVTIELKADEKFQQSFNLSR